MPSQKNIQTVEDLKQSIKNAKSILIADYSGLDSSAQTDLRAKIKDAGGEFSVTKNRLFQLAITDALVEGKEAMDEVLNGPNAFLFSYDDAVSALKTIFEFAKENEALEIKLGFMDGRVLSLEETKALSELPSKPELISQLISRIQSPAYGLVSVIGGPTRVLVNVLEQIRKQKEAN